MAKHLNISLGVTADTSKAKAQLQDLQNQLTKIINSPTSNRMDLAKEIREASQAAAELQAHLKNATNVDTGTLDFDIGGFHGNPNSGRAGILLQRVRICRCVRP